MEIVFWKKNLFMLPTGSIGKRYVREISRLMNAWQEDSPLKNIAFKAIHIMPNMLLQKPSKKSKAREHTEALKRRLELWEQGNIEELFREAKAIQKQLKSGNAKADIMSTSKRFAGLMKIGNVNGALKLLTDSMSGGILPLNEETLNLLIQKHPDSQEVGEEIILEGPIEEVHPIVFEEIDSTLIAKVASQIKGGSGPSGMDAQGWRKILVSKVYGQEGEDLRKVYAEVIKKMCREKINDKSLESFLACRLVPLDKKPGLRPIGIGEILRRIAGKVVMSISKNDVMNSVSRIQLCAGQEAGCEAAIHSVRSLFDKEDTEAVLLVDAENAFNNINRSSILRNIEIVCPKIAIYVFNCIQLSWLIVKDQFESKAIETFKNSNVNITSLGQRHLGAVIGSLQYKKEYCENLVGEWVKELEMLSKIGEIEPHCAYTAFTGGFRGKFTYFIRTIPGFEKYLGPVEDLLRLKFIPAITGGHICTDVERDLLSLPAKMGGLGIINVKEIAQQEFENSIQMTESLVKIVNRTEDNDISINDIDREHS